MKTRFNPIFLSLIVIGMSQAANAESATWTGTTDSNWSDVTNWGGPPAVVPSVAGDVATFDGGGNGNTAITGIPTLAISQILFDLEADSYTFSSSITWSVPADGGVTVTDTVTADQDLSGIQFIRPAGNTTIKFVNQGSGLLKLGTMFNTNTVANKNARILFAPVSGSVIEIASGKTIDNATTAGRTTSILLDDEGTLKMSGTGNYTGPDIEGNGLTLHRGTMQVSSVNNIADAGRTGIGRVGRIQFGQAGESYTATLRYENVTAATTDRPFHIIDGNTGVLDIADETSSLALTGILTASGTTNGGGNLTKKGLGTLTISGATNTFNGVTRVEEGTLKLGNLLAIQNSAYDTSSPGTLDLSELVGTPTFGGLTSATAYNLPSNLTLSPPAGRTVTFSGVLGETTPGLTLNKTGGGTQILSGDNTYTGATTLGISRSTGPDYISSGALRFLHNNAAGSGTIVINGGYEAGRVELSGDVTLTNAITLQGRQGATWPAVVNFSDDNTLSGNINVVANGARLTFRSDAGKLTVSGAAMTGDSGRVLTLRGAATGEFAKNITAAVVANIEKADAGTWTLSGANTYAGNTTINGGTLVLSATSSTRFLPTADGLSNKITGNTTGAATLNGALDIDLTAAVTAPAATSWLLVDVDNVDETYESGFTVTGFTETAADSGIWEKTMDDKTFTFTQTDGRLTLAVESLSGFDSWITKPEFGTLADATATGDPDHDGIENLVEYVLNGMPNVSDQSILPEFATTGTDFVFTFTRQAISADDTTQIFQYGNDLIGWTDVNITAPVGTQVSFGTVEAGLEPVTVTVPKESNTKLFGRLKVTRP